MNPFRLQPRLVTPVGVDRILKRRVKTSMRSLNGLKALKEYSSYKPRSEVSKKSRKRAQEFIDAAKSKKRSQAGDEKKTKIELWEKRKNQIKERLVDIKTNLTLRSPEKVMADLADRAKRLKTKTHEHATILLKALGINKSDVLKKLRKLDSGKKLVQMGLEVRVLKIGKQPPMYYEIKLPISRRKLGSEVLNIAWAIKEIGKFEAAWPGDKKLAIFASESTHAKRAPRVFAWHMDMMRGRQAHCLNSTVEGGPALGKGVVIAHPDTGWADHPEYNKEQIDESKSLNVLNGNIGEKNACHSIVVGSMETHGTATGSLMIGGHEPSDRLNIAAIPEESLEFGELLGNRYLFGTNPQVDQGHILGIAPRAKVVPIRFISDNIVDWDEAGIHGGGVVRIGEARFAEILDYAVRIGANVMSLSVGGTFIEDVREAFRTAIEEDDLIVVAAAGQTYLFNMLSWRSDQDSVVEPACWPDVIAVAGCSVDGRPWDESHRGPNVDITAPCDGIWVAEFDRERWEENDEGEKRLPIIQAASGTSFSAAIMAGAAALWLSHWGGKDTLKNDHYPNKPLAWVFREILQRTAKPIFNASWDHNNFGPGIINLEAMLKEPLPPEHEIPEPPATVDNLLTLAGEGLGFIYGVGEWMEDRYQDLEAGVRVSTALIDIILESTLMNAKELLAIGYAALEEGREAVEEKIEAGEQFVEDTVDALEDLGEQLADAGEEVVEDVEDFFEDVGEDIGEVLNGLEGLFG